MSHDTITINGVTTRITTVPGTPLTLYVPRDRRVRDLDRSNLYDAEDWEELKAKWTFEDAQA